MRAPSAASMSCVRSVNLKSASAPQQVIVARGVVVAVGRAGLRQADEFAVRYKRVEVVIHRSLRDFGIFLLHLQKNLLGGRVLGGAQDEIENLLGVLGHVFLLNKN